MRLRAVHHTQGNMTAERRFPKLEMQPLSKIMASLGHTWIDVLKVSLHPDICLKQHDCSGFLSFWTDKVACGRE